MKTPFKWPRFQFNIRTLLNAMLLCGLAIGWAIWPIHTARNFQAALTSSNIEELVGLMDSTEAEVRDILKVSQDLKTPLSIELNSRGAEDVVLGRQQFLIGNRLRGLAVRGRVQNLYCPIFFYFEVTR